MVVLGDWDKGWSPPLIGECAGDGNPGDMLHFLQTLLSLREVSG